MATGRYRECAAGAGGLTLPIDYGIIGLAGSCVCQGTKLGYIRVAGLMRQVFPISSGQCPGPGLIQGFATGYGLMNTGLNGACWWYVRPDDPSRSEGKPPEYGLPILTEMTVGLSDCKQARVALRRLNRRRRWTIPWDRRVRGLQCSAVILGSGLARPGPRHEGTARGHGLR